MNMNTGYSYGYNNNFASSMNTHLPMYNQPFVNPGMAGTAGFNPVHHGPTVAPGPMITQPIYNSAYSARARASTGGLLLSEPGCMCNGQNQTSTNNAGSHCGTWG